MILQPEDEEPMRKHEPEKKEKESQSRDSLGKKEGQG